MRKPETFDELCESLTKPYSTAKQYFDIVILEFDVYGDSQYFYDWFSDLEEKKQDTVYNNLQRIYSAMNEGAKQSISSLKVKLVENTKKIDDCDTDKLNTYLENCVEAFNKISDECIISTKLSLIAHLLNTIDSYRRVHGAVDYKECEKRCSEHETQYNNLKKLTMLNVIVCFVISVVSSFFMIYIVGLIGINTFVDFVNDNIIQLVIGGIGSIIASIVVYYKNFYKKL